MRLEATTFAIAQLEDTTLWAGSNRENILVNQKLFQILGAPIIVLLTVPEVELYQYLT